MSLHLGSSDQYPDFRNQFIMGLAIACILFLTPFAINNFFQGRLAIGLGAVVIILIFAVNAWAIVRQQRYYPMLLLYGLVPATLFFLSLSMRQQGMIGVFWSYPAAISFYFMLPERQSWFASAAFLAVIMPLIWTNFETPLALRINVTLLMVNLFAALFINVITKQQKILKLQAVTDPLTGVLNRTLLVPELQEAVQQHRRSDLPMSLIMFDLDHFKRINDELGHDAGDDVLRDVGTTLRNRCRLVDKVFRLGGEEFLVFLYNTDLASAVHVAEDFQQRIALLQTLPDRTITASIGVAMLESYETWRDWMKRSDNHLYQAKAGGRNQIIAE